LLGGTTGLHAALANALQFVFDESGNATYQTNTTPIAPYANHLSGAGIFFTEQDPVGGLANTNVLVYDLPQLTDSGVVEVLEPGGAVGDVLWFTNSSKVNDGGLDANLLIYYSGDTAGQFLADSGLPTFTPSLGSVNEVNGQFQFLAPLPGSPNGRTYANFGIEFDGTSDTPEPGSVSMLLLGGLCLGFGAWRRKARA
jgi:hypothetical protein